MQTLSNCKKNKTFRTATSNETAIIQKIVLSKSCILDDLYQQSQTSKNQKHINFIYKFLEVSPTALFYNVHPLVLFPGIMQYFAQKNHIPVISVAGACNPTLPRAHIPMTQRMLDLIPFVDLLYSDSKSVCLTRISDLQDNQLIYFGEGIVLCYCLSQAAV